MITPTLDNRNKVSAILHLMNDLSPAQLRALRTEVMALKKRNFPVH